VAAPDDAIVQFDFGAVLLTLAGISVASAFAILAGTVSARVFFDATKEHDR